MTIAILLGITTFLLLWGRNIPVIIKHLWDYVDDVERSEYKTYLGVSIPACIDNSKGIYVGSLIMSAAISLTGSFIVALLWMFISPLVIGLFIIAASIALLYIAFRALRFFRRTSKAVKKLGRVSHVHSKEEIHSVQIEDISF